MNQTFLILAFTVSAIAYWRLVMPGLRAANRSETFLAVARLFMAFVVAAAAGILGYFYVLG